MARNRSIDGRYFNKIPTITEVQNKMCYGNISNDNDDNGNNVDVTNDVFDVNENLE